MQPNGGYTLLYFVKSKNDTKCKNFVNLLCSYVNTFVLLYFLRFQEGGATAPLAPPKSATEYIQTFVFPMILGPYPHKSATVCYLDGY